jgi:hypothetical protein
MQKKTELIELDRLIELADVPSRTAHEALAAGLLRPDRDQRGDRPLFRCRLAGWLKKLAMLREAGFEWNEIAAWAGRRFGPGHEDERRWPRGVKTRSR